MLHAGMHNMIMNNPCLTCKCYATFFLQFKVQPACVSVQISYSAVATTAACDAEYIPVCMSALLEKLDWAHQALDLLFVLRPHMTSSSMCQIGHLNGVKLIGELLLPQAKAVYQEWQQGQYNLDTL